MPGFSVLICGAAGRMGRAVAEQAKQAGVDVLAGIDTLPADLPFPVYPDFSHVSKRPDVLIDFSKPELLSSLLAFAMENRIPAVLATTGYTDAQLQEIHRAAEIIPIFRSANMSIGVALLRRLISEAVRTLGPAFDIEIVEAHHNQKVDAPSGTALMLLDAVKKAAGDDMQAVYGRSGPSCKRTAREIGVHALRGGTVAGEHEVCFFGPMERIRISHSAENRSVFAIGALRAAAFLIGKPAGEYSMDELISESAKG